MIKRQYTNNNVSPNVCIWYELILPSYKTNQKCLYLKDIFLAPAGSLCSDFGYQVASCEQCRGTIDFIKEAYPTATEQFKTDNTIPNWNDAPHPDGCIINIQYVQVGCNDHGTGAKNYRDQQVCVLPNGA